VNITTIWREHGTKILGLIVLAKDIIAVALTVEGIIPLDLMKWALFANLVLGILITRRGFVNTARGDTDDGKDSGV
jgi:hypothetical protein